MKNVVFTRNYAAFISLVNLHLEARHHKPAEDDELKIVEKWFNDESMKKGAYIDAVAEIMDKRTKS